jgi:hypothetical protein
MADHLDPRSAITHRMLFQTWRQPFSLRRESDHFQ